MSRLLEVRQWLAVAMLPLTAFALYAAIANMAFQYRNPLANDMALFREPAAVLSFDRLPEYQPLSAPPQ